MNPVAPVTKYFTFRPLSFVSAENRKIFRRRVSCRALPCSTALEVVSEPRVCGRRQTCAGGFWGSLLKESGPPLHQVVEQRLLDRVAHLLRQLEHQGAILR